MNIEDWKVQQAGLIILAFLIKHRACLSILKDFGYILLNLLSQQEM